MADTERSFALLIGDTAVNALKEILQETVHINPRQLDAWLDERLNGLKQNVLERILSGRGRSTGNVELHACKSLRSIVEAYYEPLVNGLMRLGLGFIDAEYETVSKLLIGASSGVFSAIFEVGLAWDMLFDLPYIPGSSIKGLVRSWALRRCAELSSDKRRRCAELVFQVFGAAAGRQAGGEESSWFEEVFGGVPRAREPAGGWVGLVTFYDSYPVRGGSGVLACGLLEPDVITPHYYRGGEPVRDEFEACPVPVPHLVVAPGTVFRMVVSLDPGGEDTIRSLVSLLGRSGFHDGVGALTWLLASALGEGVGARTGKGYGAVQGGEVRLQPVSIRFHRGSRSLSWE